MLRAVLGGTGVLGLATSALGIAWLAPWIVRVMAPGFARDPGQDALASLLTRVMFPVPGPRRSGGLRHGRAQRPAAASSRRAIAPAVQNVGMILCVLLLAGHVNPPILSLAVGVVLGGLGQVAVQLPDLHRIGYLVTPSREMAHPAVGQVARLLLPSVLALAAVQVNVFVITLLASLLAPGSISFLYYADRVMEFPLGIFGIALASAVAAVHGSPGRRPATRRGLATTLGFALRMAVFVSVPATVGLCLLRTPITRVLFERGRFRPRGHRGDRPRCSGSPSVWLGFAGARIAAQTFYALREPGVAVRLGVLAVAVNLRGRGDPHASDGARWPRPGFVDRCLCESLRPVVGSPARLRFTGWPGPGDLRRAHAGGERTARPLVRAHAIRGAGRRVCAGSGLAGGHDRRRRGGLPRRQHAPRLSGARHAARGVAVAPPPLI